MWPPRSGRCLRLWDSSGALQGSCSRYFGEFNGYVFPTKQSDRVPRTRTRRYYLSKTKYYRIQVTKAGPFTWMVVFGIEEGLWFPSR